MGEMAVPEHMCQEQGSPQHQLALRHILCSALMCRMVGGVRGRGRGIDHADIAEQKHTLPRDQYVVEEDDGVHLLEARSEGMLEVRLPDIKTLATQEFEAWRAAGDGETEGVGAMPFGHTAHAWRIHSDLVCQRAEGRQYTCAMHYDASVGLPRHAQRGIVGKVKGAGDVPAALQIDQ